MSVLKITSEEQYQERLNRMKVIFNSDLGTPESYELDLLADAIEIYEDKHYPV